MASSPWLKFYPQDWRADEKLRLCSLAARGLWIEMLALMHRSERYGLLLINGIVPSDAQLAVQVGAPPHEVTASLAELEVAGVFSRSASGAIYSRRMKRDEKSAKNARENGKHGGNPSLCKNGRKASWDKGSVKPSDKGGLKPQKPEARDQIERAATNVADRKSGSSTWPCPPGVDPDHWRDFLKNRRTRRLTNSETAYRGQLREIAKLSSDEWPPGRLVQHAAEKGWGGIYDPREHRNERSLERHQPADGLSSTARAAVSVFGPD